MKKNNTKIKKFLAIIKKIEKVRSKNNKNWMDLYRLSLAVAPEQSIKIIKKIFLVNINSFFQLIINISTSLM